ncbi:MAG: HAD family acid phosphatase [Gemmatimonadaceae bacterium]
MKVHSPRFVELIALVALGAAACGSPTVTPTPQPVPPPVEAPRVTAPAKTVEPERPAAPRSRKLPNDIHWFRASAEYRALARQAYTVAGDRLPILAKGLRKKSWAVILDADETVLDNSEYQRRRYVLDSGYTDASWENWVNEKAARAIPGAAEFTKRVHTLGGRVAIVTNRSELQCEATRTNLRSVGIETDIVLCQPLKERDKNPRFHHVQSGTAVPGMPALTVVEWIGDNITDFPGMSQIARSEPAALAGFGKRYFMLPNPMYGSWEANRDP